MIGGEFHRDPLSVGASAQSVDRENVRFVMSGRTGISLICRELKATKAIQKILLPSYCSRSMIQPIIAEGISVDFFHVFFNDGHLSVEYNYDHDCDCILLMDYFGFCSDWLPIIASKERQNGRVVICDMTQSLFCNRDYRNYSDYTVASYRKWFPSMVGEVWSRNGFSLIADHEVNTHFEILRQQVYSSAYSPVDGYLFRQAEHELKTNYRGYIPSEQEVSFALNFDFEQMRQIRIKNAKTLTSLLQETTTDNITLVNKQINDNDCPLYVPILVKDDNIRRDLHDYLLKNGIEAFIHWDFSPYHSQKYQNDRLFTSEMSLFCDQRYSYQEMAQTSLKISQYFEIDHKKR